MKNKSNIGGIMTSLLLVVFVVLKLIGVIEWSWVWVLSPLWVPLVLAVIVLAIILIIKVL